ncbi:MAG TPA: CAP domain-containing protein [Azospirillaceae bacterium]|nr:CAP domain-containing protein [Azospirillaceae bacterium]
MAPPLARMPGRAHMRTMETKRRVGPVGRRAVLGGFAALAVGAPAPVRAAGAMAPEAAAAYLDAYAAWRRRAPDTTLAPLERSALAATNARRAADRARPLAEEPELRRIARFYAHATLERFAHVDAAGRTPQQRVGLLHRRLVGELGENLFEVRATFDMLHHRGDPERQAEAGEFAVDSLMDSPGHRRNILEPRWTHGGMGAAQGPNGFALVQLFANRVVLLEEDLPLFLPPGAPLPAEAFRFAEGAADHVAPLPLDRPATRVDLGDPALIRLPARPGAVRLAYAVARSRLQTRTGSTTSFDVFDGPIVLVR